MIISVASGKGGTGKTTIAINLALSLKSVQFLDCDVEAPNAHIFLKPIINSKKQAFVTIPKVDMNLCDNCGKCSEICLYNAIATIKPTNNSKGSVLIFPHLCHSCGACTFLCHKKALIETKREIGKIELGTIKDITFIHGLLNIGEAMAPPLIKEIKNLIDKTKTVIIDSPPGTTCPFITAVKGSDFCVLVTEPTPFGLNDLILAVEVLRKIKIPFGVVINREDIGNKKVEEYCFKEDIPILMKIPFKRGIAEAYSKGSSIIEIYPEYISQFKNLYNEIIRLLEFSMEKK